MAYHLHSNQISMVNKEGAINLVLMSWNIYYLAEMCNIYVMRRDGVYFNESRPIPIPHGMFVNII